MLRAHIGFTACLASLLFTPKVPLSSLGLEFGVANTGVFLGFLGFGLWCLISPSSVLRAPHQPTSAPLFCMFGGALLLSSIASGKLESTLYAVQLCLYLVLSARLFGKYFEDARSAGQLSASTGLLKLIGVIYAAGILISLGAGPIFTLTNPDSQTLVENVWIDRGIGFADNVNGAGGVMAMFLPLALFGWAGARKSTLRDLGLLFLYLAALFATLSRSATLSGVLALGIVTSYLAFKMLISKSGSVVPRVLLRIVLGVILSTAGVSILFTSEKLVPALSGLVYRFSASSGSLRGDVEYRSELWRAGLEYWKDLPFADKLVGVGFRNSMVRLSTWQTFHNFYVVLLNEAGLIGLIAFCSAVVAFIIRHVRSRNLARGRSPALVSVAAVLALCVHNMSEVFLYSPLFASLLMLFVCYGDVASPEERRSGGVAVRPLRLRWVPRQAVDRRCATGSKVVQSIVVSGDRGPGS